MIKNRIKVILAEKGIRQNDLAEGIGISKSTLSGIINNLQNCTLETAFDIAKFLNKSIEEVFYKVPDNVDDNLRSDYILMVQRIQELYNLYKQGILTIEHIENMYKGFIDEFIRNHGIEKIEECKALVGDTGKYELNNVALSVIKKY